MESCTLFVMILFIYFTVITIETNCNEIIKIVKNIENNTLRYNTTKYVFSSNITSHIRSKMPMRKNHTNHHTNLTKSS